MVIRYDGYGNVVVQHYNVINHEQWFKIKFFMVSIPSVPKSVHLL